tara:strand:- start:155 stop:340 length:186 start_codon:yes stop_codon:yes gene_type:complete
MTEHEVNIAMIRQFKSGLGCEDIAINMGIPASDARDMMRKLSNLGVFQQPSFYTKRRAVQV